MQGPKELQAFTELGTPNLYISEGLRAELRAWVLADPSELSNQTREGTQLFTTERLSLFPGEEMLNPNK
jgi:hypothetical protein